MVLVTGATGHKVPRRAWLEFEGQPVDGGSLLIQTAHLAPHGLAGNLSWSALRPIHAAIFGNLVRCVAGRMRSLAPVALPGSGP